MVCLGSAQGNELVVSAQLCERKRSVLRVYASGTWQWNNVIHISTKHHPTAPCVVVLVVACGSLLSCTMSR